MSFGILKLQNPIQPYAWGSTTAIPNLLGVANPQNRPQAELWMGSHPQAPSQVTLAGRAVSLEKIIAQSPAEILGKKTARCFHSSLPFLFKVLAAAQPLSIQAHPDQAQARIGFARENRLGLALTAYNRNYKDPRPKPELICALSPFWLLKGFRSAAAMRKIFQRLQPASLLAELGRLRLQPRAAGLKHFFYTLLSLPREKQSQVAAEAAAAAARWRDQDPAFVWVEKLHGQYPGDIGVLSPLWLNLVCLDPGQALFLAARELHTYLEGVGIEIMANSDNVLRGGLTAKYVNVPELLQVLKFKPSRPRILNPQTVRPGEKLYPARVREFQLSVLEVENGRPYESPARQSVEILLTVEGRARIVPASAAEAVDLGPGASVLIPAAVPRYRLEGQARLFKATVPD